MYIGNIALNILQWLLCHKTKLNQAKPFNLHLIYRNKQDLPLNNIKLLICHKPKPSAIIYI